MLSLSAPDKKSGTVAAPAAGEEANDTVVAGKSVGATSTDTSGAPAPEIRALTEAYPEYRPYMKSSGTFNWRPVRGSKRMSAHSYGIAFDIAVNKSNYWQWECRSNDEMKRFKYRNRIPRKIVEIFEKHGFIWGGAWYHYDTMHFEFRPEILNYARCEN